MFLHPADMLHIAEQRQVARRGRAALVRLARSGRSVDDQPQHTSHRLDNVVTLTSPSVRTAAFDACVA